MVALYWIVLEVCKQNGSEYLPKTLYAPIFCFKRFYEHIGVHDVNLLCSADAIDSVIFDVLSIQK